MDNEELMPIPKSPRVVYRHNPLAQVICQLRFPPILRIARAEPVDFQEAIRAVFPRFGVMELRMDVGAPEYNRPPGVGVSTLNSYLFQTEDQQWTVTLNRETLTVETQNYQNWEEFEARLTLPLDALQQVYRPGYWSRIGLRYVDMIRRENLGLPDTSWTELLNPFFTGPLGSDELGNEISEWLGKVRIPVQRDAAVNIVYGLWQEPGQITPCYIIDSDFFVDRRQEVKDANPILREFRETAGDLFRWSIKPRLSDALERSV